VSIDVSISKTLHYLLGRVSTFLVDLLQYLICHTTCGSQYLPFSRWAQDLKR